MPPHDVHLRADEAPGFPGEWCGPVQVSYLREAPFTSVIRDGEIISQSGIQVPAPGPLCLSFDARRPEVAARIVAWAFAGEKCPHPEADRVFFSCPGEARWDCMRCNTQLPGTGQTRPPHDLTPFLPTTLPGGRIVSVEHSAAVLVAAVRGIVAGVGPIAGVLGAWQDDERPLICGRAARKHVVYGRLLRAEEGWTSADGSYGYSRDHAAADRAALAHRFALLDADTLTLPAAGYLTSSTPSHTSES
jgi:hypothetical protein